MASDPHLCTAVVQVRQPAITVVVGILAIVSLVVVEVVQPRLWKRKLFVFLRFL